MKWSLLSVAFVSLLITSACETVAPTTLAVLSTPTVASSIPSPVATQTLTPPPPTPTVISTVRPLNLNPQIVVLSENFVEPDDLVLAGDGSIYISDVSAGTIKQYTTDGQLNLVLSGLHSPEGMAFLPDGAMIIAEQGTNRLVRYDLNSRTLIPFLDLVNNTNQLGVDGILWDGENLIVPDSPNGNVLEVSADGQTVRPIASGLARPTGAWLEATGDLLIADENGNAVYRLHHNGKLDLVANLPIPDDVVADASGNIFVITLGDNALHLLKVGTNEDVTLVGNLIQPQGIIFDRDGNLIVTDSGNHRLIRVFIH